ncbi:MAG: tetratricopeptide repeat protein [Candidatus Binatia bacterium]
MRQRQKAKTFARSRLLLLCLAFTLLSAAARAAEDIATGIRLFESGRLADARRFFEALVKKAPAEAAGAFYLGRIAFKEEQYDRAVEWLEKAVQLAGGNSEYHLWLGRAYGHQAQRATVIQQPLLARKVKEHFEKAVALDPDNLAARSDLMDYYLTAPSLLGGSKEKAQKQAEEIRKRTIQKNRPIQ